MLAGTFLADCVDYLCKVENNILELTQFVFRTYVGKTGARSIQELVVKVILRKHSTDKEMPSTVVGWKSTSRHTLQKSGVKKTKLTRCSKKITF